MYVRVVLPQQLFCVGNQAVEQCFGIILLQRDTFKQQIRLMHIPTGVRLVNQPRHIAHVFALIGIAGKA